MKRLETTRETILELAAEDGTSPPERLPPRYREILALFEQTAEGLRAKEVSRALGPGTEARHTENTRAKLKHLVTRDILTEPEPGLFTLSKATPATSNQLKLKLRELSQSTLSGAGQSALGHRYGDSVRRIVHGGGAHATKW